MAGYYQYIAAGTKVDRVVWAEPYIDASGLGEMTTGSLPVYVEEDGVAKEDFFSFDLLDDA